jgi:hypothetical protein
MAESGRRFRGGDVCFLVIEKQTRDAQTRTSDRQNQINRYSIFSANTQKRTVQFQIGPFCRGAGQRPEAGKTQIPIDHRLQPAGSGIDDFLTPPGV